MGGCPAFDTAEDVTVKDASVRGEIVQPGKGSNSFNSSRRLLRTSQFSFLFSFHNYLLGCQSESLPGNSCQ